MISKSEVRAISSPTGVKEPSKQTQGLQNHKLKHALAQYISRLRRGEGKNKGESIKRDSRSNESISRISGSSFR